MTIDGVNSIRSDSQKTALEGGADAMRRPCFVIEFRKVALAAIAASHLFFSGAALAEDAPEGDLTPKPSGGSAEQDASPPAETTDSSASSSSDITKKDDKPKTFKSRLIDTSIEEKPAASTQTAEDEKSDEYKERLAKLPEHLKKLAEAPYIFDNTKGGSSEYTTAYIEASKLAHLLRNDLMWIVENGSPAGKIYAASLIRLFDAPAGTNILNGFREVKTLVTDKTKVSTEHYTTGEIATDLLSGSPSIQLKPR